MCNEDRRDLLGVMQALQEFVPYSLSKDMDATLDKAGVMHEFITVDGAEHRLAGATPEEVSRVAARAVEFVKAHTE